MFSYLRRQDLKGNLNKPTAKVQIRFTPAAAQRRKESQLPSRRCAAAREKLSGLKARC
jgi:hypothetical protein